MKSEAYYLVKNGDSKDSFELRKFDLNEPEEDEVIIETEAFGLNYADVMARRGLYREAPPLPSIIGYEVVGKVIKVGAKVNPDLMGKRVMAFTRFGGYSRHVCTIDKAVVPVGDEPAEDLLSLCTQGVTAFYMASHLTSIRSTDIVLIHAAAGGVGSLLIQIAKSSGATVIAKIGNDSKRQLVETLGADHIVNYNQEDYTESINRFLKGKRLDVSFNPVAGATYKKDMALLGSGGRMILFGGSELGRAKWGILSKLNFVRKMGFLLPIRLMMQSKSVMGVNMLKIGDNRPEIMEHCLRSVAKLYQSGTLQPYAGGKYNHTSLWEAHASLESGNTTGKLSVFWK